MLLLLVTILMLLLPPLCWCCAVAHRWGCGHGDLFVWQSRHLRRETDWIRMQIGSDSSIRTSSSIRSSIVASAPKSCSMEHRQTYRLLISPTISMSISNIHTHGCKGRASYITNPQSIRMDALCAWLMDTREKLRFCCGFVHGMAWLCVLSDQRPGHYYVFEKTTPMITIGPYDHS